MFKHHKKHCKRQPVNCVNSCGVTGMPREEVGLTCCYYANEMEVYLNY